MRVYTSRVIEHKEKLGQDNWTEVVIDLRELSGTKGEATETLESTMSSCKSLNNIKPQDYLKGRLMRKSGSADG